MIFKGLPWLYYTLHMIYNSHIMVSYVYKSMGFDTGYVLIHFI